MQIDYIRTYSLDEYYLYGSSRLGAKKQNEVIYREAFTGNIGSEYWNPSVSTQNNLQEASIELEDFNHRVGIKRFELTNHLGNVLSVISDRKLAIDNNTDNQIDYFEADIASAQDYYPFGMQMPGRTYSNSAFVGGYRYGFNGMERDDELNGSGNAYNFGARMYDSRLGRWLALDPQIHRYRSLSPYNFAGLNPILYEDPDGERIRLYRSLRKSGIKNYRAYVRAMKSTDTGKETWANMKKSHTFFTINTMDKVLVLPHENGVNVLYGEGVTLLNTPNPKSNEQGGLITNQGGGERHYYDEAEIIISLGTLKMSQLAFYNASQDGLVWEEMSNFERNKYLNDARSTLNLKLYTDLLNDGQKTLLWFASPNSPLSISGPTALGESVGVKQEDGSTDKTKLFVPTPLSNESNEEYLNRVGVHEGDHAFWSAILWGKYYVLRDLHTKENGKSMKYNPDFEQVSDPYNDINHEVRPMKNEMNTIEEQKINRDK